MSIKLFGCVCGQFHSPGAGLGMPGEHVSVPVPFYVIEHPDGVAVFDCGLHADMMDADDPYRRRLRRQEMDVSLTPEETVTRSLERLDIDPAAVRFAEYGAKHGCNRLTCDSAKGRRSARGRSPVNRAAAPLAARRSAVVARRYGSAEPCTMLKVYGGETDEQFGAAQILAVA